MKGRGDIGNDRWYSSNKWRKDGDSDNHDNNNEGDDNDKGSKWKQMTK